jgi:hypothetical protein
LLVAIAIMAMGAALLVGSSSAGRSAARAQRSYEASVRAAAESHRVLAALVGGWSAREDSITIGASLATTITAEPTVTTRTRLMRIGERRWVVAVDCQVGPDDAVLARRRLQLLLERPPPRDSLAPGPPVLVRPWGLADLY